MADVWPPEPFDIAFARFAELDAWYSGDAETLAAIYNGTSAANVATHTINGRSYRGGILGSLSKMFIGQPVVAGEKRMRMHLPLAADLCTLSADLLFGEAPQVLFRKPDDVVDAKPDESAKAKKWVHPAQDRLDKIIASDEAHAELLLAGEYSAALGGAYLAVAWDPAVSDHVFPKAYAADCAIPEFRHGRLVGVRLWTEYRDGNIVYRLVERHSPGTISYTLYKGTDRTLGEVRPLGERPETAHYESLRNPSDIAAAIAAPGTLSDSLTVGTGTQRLAVTYMPNARPVRDWRKLGTLAHLGRSDLDGVQDILDKVDMAWSSLMRDLENGQGRLVMPEEMLTVSTTPGVPATADIYRQVFTPVGGTLGKSADGSGPMTIVQFAIRVEEHLQIIEGLKKEIASAIGYSPSHLGIEQTRRGDKTATEVTADLTDSERTRDKKALYAKAALARWALAALEIDKTVFAGDDIGDLSEMPDVVFAPVSQADPEKLARTAQLLDAARAATREEIVRTIHPDWDEQDIKDEADAIRDEMAAGSMLEPDMPLFEVKPKGDGEEPPADE